MKKYLFWVFALWKYVKEYNKIFWQKYKIISLSKPSFKSKDLFKLIFLSNMSRKRWIPAHHRDRLVYVLLQWHNKWSMHAFERWWSFPGVHFKAWSSQEYFFFYFSVREFWNSNRNHFPLQNFPILSKTTMFNIF